MSLYNNSIAARSRRSVLKPCFSPPAAITRSWTAHYASDTLFGLAGDMHRCVRDHPILQRLRWTKERNSLGACREKTQRIWRNLARCAPVLYISGPQVAMPSIFAPAEAP